MGLKDIIAKARTSATGALTRHRNEFDQGIDKVGEVANTKTGGRYETRIREGSDQARSGLDKIGPARDQARPDTDLTARPPARRIPETITPALKEPETLMSHTPSDSGLLRRAAAGLAIVLLPLTMAASCDTGEEQDQQEQQQDQEEEDGQEEDD